MGTNITFIEPNMALYFTGTELQFFNMSWRETESTGFRNTLVQRASDGSVVPPSYVTSVELTTPVVSLLYNGNWFWSLQPANNLPNFTGWIIRKWETNETSAIAECINFKAFPGLGYPKCLALEYYNFPLAVGVTTSDNVAEVSDSYAYALDRLLEGQQVTIGPNVPGDYYVGTIKEVRSGSPNYEIEFESYFNATYVASHNCFVETRVYVFDQTGTLYIVNPIDLSLLSQIQEDRFLNVSACDFTIIDGLSEINLGNRVQSLFYLRDMMVYCADVTDSFDTTQTITPIVVSGETVGYLEDISNNDLISTSLPYHYKDYGNDFIDVYELRIRNDNPGDPSNHPQYYMLQKEYREDYDSDLGNWSTYNYVTRLIEAQTTFMVFNVQPQIIQSGEIADCKCTILDDYRRPVSGISTDWTATVAGEGGYLDPVSQTTNASGIVYNRFVSSGTLTFPLNLQVSSSDM